MLRQLLRKSQLADYLYVSARNALSAERRQSVIDFYRSSRYLHYETLGDKNPDKVIYMLDPVKSYTSGFFSNLSMVLFKYDFAHEHGMEPVTYKGNLTHYAEPVRFLGTDNYFEYFFRQPAGISLEDALSSRHVIWGEGKHLTKYDSLSMEKQDGILIRELKKNLIFRDEVFQEMEKSRKEFIGNKKVLGVKYRGTGYKEKLKGHPVFIPPQELIGHVKKMYSYGFDSIYLATEDETALKQFEKYFGNRLIYDRSILRAGEGQIHVDLARSSPKDHTAYREGLNVLKDVWVLSHAAAFAGSQCGVTRFADLFNRAYCKNRYEYLDIIDKGVYKKGRNSIKEGKKRYQL